MTLECHISDGSLNHEDGDDNEPFLSRSQSVGIIHGGGGESALSDQDKLPLADNAPLMDILVHHQSSKDDETESINLEQAQCRICLDIGGDDLIAPCQCRGTQKFVHRSCLDIWRAAKEGFAFAHCTECRALFRLQANVPPDRWWLRMKFQLLVLRDHVAIFVGVQLVVASLGFLVYSSYGEELKEMFGYEHHPFGFYALAGIVIMLVGLLYAFFIAIICGEKISNRHYHVLAKQELTKEYVVQNANDERSVSLDPGHVSELRMLGLY